MKKWTVYTVVGVFFLLVIALIIKNGVSNWDSFSEASLASCLSMLIVLAVSFMLTQTIVGNRKKQEILIDVAQKLSELIEDPVGYRVSTSCQDYEALLNSHKRQISNLIGLLEEKAPKFRIEKETKALREKFKEYEEFLGDHITDVDYLSNSEKELKRPLELMTQKLFEIMLKLSD